jgi:hypothetical protein
VGDADVAAEGLLPASAREADEMVWLDRRPDGNCRSRFLYLWFDDSPELRKRFVHPFDESRYVPDRDIIVTDVGSDDIGSQFEQPAILFHAFLLNYESWPLLVFVFCN